MNMIIAASQISNSNTAANKIHDFVPTKPTRDHPDYYNALRKWNFQEAIANYTRAKAEACLVDITEGIALNHIDDFKRKFPNMVWDVSQNFSKDLGNVSKRKHLVEYSTRKVLGSRSHPCTWLPTQPEAGSVPSHDQLKQANAARRVCEAPRQVQHQIDTSRHQFDLPNSAVSHSKPELAQIAAQNRQPIAAQNQPYEKSLVDNAKSLFKAQIQQGPWYDNLPNNHQNIFNEGKTNI